ncbi:protein pangolin, isoforms A/H/I/S, partial [Eurytemora carolleeae]|uniref:protein pangolin, isoforms A/H/I/S n=1 Tax=Eurytemora carolleeae TaxID=1294199 RepID=UPI000C775BF0
MKGKLDPDGPPFTPPGYIGLSPYPYHSTPLGRGGSPLSFFYPEHLGSPPPAHMGGIPYSLDPHKGPVGFRGYPFSSQYSPYPDLTS